MKSVEFYYSSLQDNRSKWIFQVIQDDLPPNEDWLETRAALKPLCTEICWFNYSIKTDEGIESNWKSTVIQPEPTDHDIPGRHTNSCCMCKIVGKGIAQLENNVRVINW